MNKSRRERLGEARNFLGRAVDIIEAVQDEERDCYNNLPENLQESQRAQAMDDAVDLLGEAIGNINDASDCVEQAIRGS